MTSFICDAANECVAHINKTPEDSADMVSRSSGVGYFTHVQYI